MKTPQPNSEQTVQLKWYETGSPTLVIGLLVIFFPLGLWSMWKHTKWSYRTKSIITGLFALVLVGNSFNSTPSKQATTSSSSITSSSSSSTKSRTLLGTSPKGYQLWTDKDCVYVVGITEADLASLNTDVWGFKAAIKSETGYKCVLFE